MQKRPPSPIGAKVRPLGAEVTLLLVVGDTKDRTCQHSSRQFRPPCLETGKLAAEDDEGKTPTFRVVSENPNARTDRKIVWAREEAQRTLSVFAATLLRTIAGSESEARYLIRRLADFIDAQKSLDALSGNWLTINEVREALQLPETESDFGDEYRERRWVREHGMELIIRGALRLAAHQILGEQPHFGGKYSKEVIDRGIELLEQLRGSPPKPQAASKKKAKAETWADVETAAPKFRTPDIAHFFA
jgi:hypothetical protein